MTDLSEGSYQLTRHLLNTGHRKIICIVANRDIPVSNLRVEGYLRAFRESEYQFSPDWIVISEPSFQGGYDAARGLTSVSRHGSSAGLRGQCSPPDAIITMNDMMAIGVLQLLKKEKIRVPQDISVAGYDDLLYASLLDTPLTTVGQPIAPMCQKTVELLLNKIMSPDEISQKILLQPHLVIRHSTVDRNTEINAE